VTVVFVRFFVRRWSDGDDALVLELALLLAA
jgi:hypothetical protein